MRVSAPCKAPSSGKHSTWRQFNDIDWVNRCTLTAELNKRIIGTLYDLLGEFRGETIIYRHYCGSDAIKNDVLLLYVATYMWNVTWGDGQSERRTNRQQRCVVSESTCWIKFKILWYSITYFSIILCHTYHKVVNHALHLPAHVKKVNNHQAIKFQINIEIILKIPSVSWNNNSIKSILCILKSIAHLSF